MDSRVAYAELGLAPGASAEEVKAAWRRLVSRWHPDRNPTGQAIERTQRVNRAYEQIRRWFDEGGAMPPSREGVPAIRRKVRLTLEEAALGCVKQLRGRITHTCEPCEGRGEQVSEMACPGCRGMGTVRRASLFVWLSTTETCGVCEGDGRARRACAHCQGTGQHTDEYRRSVGIPPGMRDGDVLRVDGADDADIALELHIELVPHKLFVLDGDGILRCEIPVDGFAWSAGRWIDVPTLTGLHQLRLQRGHLAYRLRGKGFPAQRHGEPGDYIVKVVPTFPESLSAEQEALLERLIAAGEEGGPVWAWKRKLRAWEARRGKATESSDSSQV